MEDFNRIEAIKTRLSEIETESDRLRAQIDVLDDESVELKRQAAKILGIKATSTRRYVPNVVEKAAAFVRANPASTLREIEEAVYGSSSDRKRRRAYQLAYRLRNDYGIVVASAPIREQKAEQPSARRKARDAILALLAKHPEGMRTVDLATAILEQGHPVTRSWVAQKTASLSRSKRVRREMDGPHSRWYLAAGLPAA